MLQATFAVLRQILLELGFTMQPGADGQVRFDHAASGTWFIFRSQKDEEAVNLPNLVAVRRILDEKGLLPRKQFEARLRSRLIAG
jgi:hypothetical protein